MNNRFEMDSNFEVGDSVVSRDGNVCGEIVSIREAYVDNFLIDLAVVEGCDGELYDEIDTTYLKYMRCGI